MKRLLFLPLIALPLLVLSCDSQAPTEPTAADEVVLASPTFGAGLPIEIIKPVCTSEAADRNGNGCWCQTHVAYPQCGPGPMFFDDVRDGFCRRTPTGQWECQTGCRQGIDLTLTDGGPLPLPAHCEVTIGRP